MAFMNKMSGGAGDSGSGEFIRRIKYDAKAGDMIAINRTMGSDGRYANTEEDVQFPVRFIFDLENLEIGWVSFESGRPDWRLGKVGDEPVKQPSPEYKEAFRIHIYNKELGLREFGSSAKTVMRKADDLHTAYEMERGANAGKVPIVEITDTEIIKINSPQGELRFKVPNWSIAGWQEKPQNMIDEEIKYGVGDAGRGTPEPATTAAPADEDDLF